MATGNNPRGRPVRTLVGLKFGTLLPYERVEETTADGRKVIYWKCFCTGPHIGKTDDFPFPDRNESRLCTVLYSALHQGRKRSCGCWRVRRKNIRTIEQHYEHATPEDYTRFGLPVPKEVLQHVAQIEQLALESEEDRIARIAQSADEAWDMIPDYVPDTTK